jgi:Ser-tRNA(Ala) deacylase AlaX
MTKLLYIEDFRLTEREGKVVKVERDGERDVVVLDQTVFYPQGGGQPYDQGVMESAAGKFLVEEVRFESGTFSAGDSVKCLVDKERRQLHARLHSAGHLVDKAVLELKLPWKPGKGYHFPNGPYDEYEGSLEGLDKEQLKADMERLCNEYIKRGSNTEVLFMSREEMEKVCHYVPDFPEEKGELARIVVHEEYYMPCGGTPVANLAEIGFMTIRKIKQEGKNIRIGYDVG